MKGDSRFQVISLGADVHICHRPGRSVRRRLRLEEGALLRCLVCMTRWQLVRTRWGWAWLDTGAGPWLEQPDEH